MLGKAKLAISAVKVAAGRVAMDAIERKTRRDGKLLAAYLLLCAVLLVPIALSYGLAPAEVLPKALDIGVEGNDQIQIFRALMCLYLAASLFWAIAAFRSDWQRPAAVWAMLFSASLAIGRIVSLAVDGPASTLLDLYLGLEIFGAALGLGLLAYTRPNRSRR